VDGWQDKAMNDYLVWEPLWQDGWCRLGPLENVDHPAWIRWGRSRAQDFPDNASFTMSPRFPYDTLPVDCITNMSGELVVSQPVVELLQRENLQHVEYLPVKLLDHRERPVDEPYAIVHPILPVDCLDIAACGPTWSAVAPDHILFIERLVIDVKRVDPNRRLFRCAAYTKAKIIHRSLANALTTAKFIGCSFVELEDYESG
jgi:hypothetical protein